MIPQFLGGSEKRGGWKNCPYLKGTPALPPLDWEKATALQMMMWRVKDVVVSNGIIECHIEKLKVEMGSWTPNCLRLHIWLDGSTLHKLCLPPNRDDSCWSLFVRLHKFLFGEIRLSSFSKEWHLISPQNQDRLRLIQHWWWKFRMLNWYPYNYILNYMAYRCDVR